MDDAHDHEDRRADGGGVDRGRVAGDHPVAFETTHSFGHRRRRQADPRAEFAEREASVSGQLVKDSPADVVEHLAMLAGLAKSKAKAAEGLQIAL